MGAKLTATQKRFDLALAGISAVLVLGFIFFGFALAGFLFFSNEVAWIFWLFGMACWTFAFAIFFLFMNSPYPKHRLER